MVRLFLGLVKGALVGAVLGLVVERLGYGRMSGYLVYGVIGAVVGLLAGRPIWSHLRDPKSTVWTAVLKGLVGFGVGDGLFVLAERALGNPTIHLFGEAKGLTSWTPVFGALVGLIYGAWVELDDVPTKDASPPKKG